MEESTAEDVDQEVEGYLAMPWASFNRACGLAGGFVDGRRGPEAFWHRQWGGEEDFFVELESLREA